MTSGVHALVRRGSNELPVRRKKKDRAEAHPTHILRAADNFIPKLIRHVPHFTKYPMNHPTTKRNLNHFSPRQAERHAGRSYSSAAKSPHETKQKRGGMYATYTAHLPSVQIRRATTPPPPDTAITTTEGRASGRTKRQILLPQPIKKADHIPRLRR